MCLLAYGLLVSISEAMPTATAPEQNALVHAGSLRPGYSATPLFDPKQFDNLITQKPGENKHIHFSEWNNTQGSVTLQFTESRPVKYQKTIEICRTKRTLQVSFSRFRNGLGRVESAYMLCDVWAVGTLLNG